MFSLYCQKLLTNIRSINRVTLQLSILLWSGIHTKYLQKRSWLTFWGLPHVDTLQNALLWLLNR